MSRDFTFLEIAEAFIKKEFIFYYQPVISLVTGKICGAEALIRWKNKNGEIISPGEFIPKAEESGLITEITLEAISTIFRDLAEIDQSDQSIWVSFNTSAKDFMDHRVADYISNQLANFALVPDRVHLEITETAFLPFNQQTKQSIFDIHDMGLEIVLNDFTAGYSTFDYLSRLPFSSLKIALPLTQRTTTSRMDWKLFRHLVSLGHQLDLDVIAEGVETDDLHRLILSTGCTSAQGYYYSHPLPLADFILLIRKEKTWVSFPYGLMYLAQIDHIDFRRDVIREGLTLYYNSDEKIKQQARKRLPDIQTSEFYFHEWFRKAVNENPESLPELHSYEKEFYDFHKSCDELLGMAEEHVSLEIFENKISEIIQISTGLTHSMVEISSKKIIDEFKPH